MSKMIQAASGHMMCVSSIDVAEFSAALPNVDASKYTKFYVVQNFDRSGVVFFYMAKGYHTDYVKTAKAAREIHVWYRKTKSMWSSFGDDMKSAIDGAQRDGWLHA